MPPPHVPGFVTVGEALTRALAQPHAQALAERLEKAATWGGATDRERRDLLTEAARFIREHHGEAA